MLQQKLSAGLLLVIVCLLARSSGSPDCLYPCHNGGYCVDGYCDCPHPYTGPTCAIQICDLTCENGGTCYSTSVGNQCFCLPGYEGTHCQYALEECGHSGHFCYNNGSCEAERCICQAPHTGDSCQVSLCTSDHYCGANGLCTVDVSLSSDYSTIYYGDHCFCHPGFTGQYCQTSMEECGCHACYNNGTCVDGSCVCTPPYTGESCLDTFAAEMCGPYDSYVCHNGRDCVNESCVCVPAYTGIDCGVGLCELVCQNNGTCHTDGRYDYCICPFGFTGQYCEMDLEACGQDGTYVCYNNGTCVDGSCVCSAAYTGYDCSYLVCPHDEQDWTVCQFPEDVSTPVCETPTIEPASSTAEEVTFSDTGNVILVTSSMSEVVNPTSSIYEYDDVPSTIHVFDNVPSTIHVFDDVTSIADATSTIHDFTSTMHDVVDATSTIHKFNDVTSTMGDVAEVTSTMAEGDITSASSATASSSIVRITEAVVESTSSAFMFVLATNKFESSSHLVSPTSSSCCSLGVSTSIIPVSSRAQSNSGHATTYLTLLATKKESIAATSSEMLQNSVSMSSSSASLPHAISSNPVVSASFKPSIHLSSIYSPITVVRSSSQPLSSALETSHASTLSDVLSTPTPTVIANDPCPREVGEVEGAVVTWPMAAPGEEVAEPCPCMRQSGKMIRRRCGPRGRWGQVDTTQCTVKMSYVVRRLCGVNDSSEQVDILMNMTSANMTLTADDVVFLVDVIQKLTRFPPTARIRNITRTAIIQTLDSILSTDEGTMRNASQSAVGQRVLDVVQSVISSFNVALNHTQVVVMQNIEFGVTILPRALLRSRGFKPAVNRRMKASFSIPPSLFKRSYDNTSSFRVGWSMVSNRGLFGNERTSNHLSDILVIDVGTPTNHTIAVGGLNTSELVEMTFEVEEHEPGGRQPECNYFDTSTERWSTRGIVRRSFSRNVVQCATNHLTAFVVLQPIGLQPTTSADTPTTSALPTEDASSVVIIASSSAGGALVLIIVTATVIFAGFLYFKFHRKRSIVMESL